MASTRTTFGALATAGAASVGLWHRLFRRPLPKTRGTIRVKGLESQVDIARDRHGVPHISARSVADLCFGQGFALAQERGWQLDLYRRIASGAEVAREGCLSIPDLTANVRRATEIVVEAFDAEGGTRVIEAEGFEARCLQHEIDHLDGLLFLDRVDSLKTDVFRRKRYA